MSRAKRPGSTQKARVYWLEAVRSGGFPHDPTGDLLHLLNGQYRLVTTRGGLPKQPSDQRRRRNLLLSRPPLQRKIKLTREDSGDGHHHFIPVDWVSDIDETVRLGKTSNEVFSQWEHE